MKKLTLFITCFSLVVLFSSCEKEEILMEEKTLTFTFDKNSFEPKDLDISLTNNQAALINLLEQNATALLKFKNNINNSKEDKQKMLIDMLGQTNKKYKVIVKKSSKK